MALVLAAVLTQLGDLITFAYLPRGAEANPIAAGMIVEAAVGAKLALVVLILALAAVFTATERPAIRDGLLLITVIAGSVGFGSNVSVLLAR